MAANDVLYLILKPAEGEDDAIRWDRLTPVVEATEALLGEGIRAVVSRRHMLAEPAREVGRPKAKLAGQPQQGSLIVPLVFEMTELATVLAKPLMAGMEQPDVVSTILSGLADSAQIIQFARDMIFGHRGTIARRNGQATTEAPDSRYEQAIEAMAPGYIDRVEALTITLMEAAERTGCQQVDVKVNDQTAIHLMVPHRRRASVNFGQSGFGPQPQQGIHVTRVDGSEMQVAFEGQKRLAFLGAGRPQPGGATTAAEFVVIWASRMSPPAQGESVSIQGRFVDRTLVEALEDVPAEWTDRSKGVLLVEQAMPVLRWQ